MGMLLAIVGFGWAFLGVLNITGLPWTDPGGNGLVTFGLIFNMVLFVIPGLLLGALGVRMQNRPAAKETPEKRIATLDGLLETGAINQAEYDDRRQRILSDI